MKKSNPLVYTVWACLSLIVLTIAVYASQVLPPPFSSGLERNVKAAVGKEPTIRVNVLSKYHPHTALLYNKKSKKTFEVDRHGDKLLVNKRETDLFSTQNKGFSADSIWNLQLPQLERRFKGVLEIYVRKGKLEIINELSIEDYLRGVLSAEFAQADPEALKAQAVLSRTLAVYQLKNRRHQPYHVVDLTIDQAFNGYNAFPSLERAIHETRGQVMTSNGEVIIPFWHSTCAGEFYTPAQMWGGPELRYLKSDPHERQLPDDLCRESVHFTWEKTSDFRIIQRIIDDNHGVIMVRGFPILKDGKIVINEEGDSIYPETFRLWVNRELGWNFIKSNHLEIRHLDGRVVFKGKGLGHNIGMCQCEAQKLAELGQDYISILHHYFKNITIAEYGHL